jgi:hypothetical protein
MNRVSIRWINRTVLTCLCLLPGRITAQNGREDVEAMLVAAIRHGMTTRTTPSEYVLTTDLRKADAVTANVAEVRLDLVAGELKLPLRPRAEIIKCTNGTRDCTMEAAAPLISLHIFEMSAASARVMVTFTWVARGRLTGESAGLILERSDGAWQVARVEWTTIR